MAEQLEEIAILVSKSQTEVSKSGNSVIIWIRYEGSAALFDRYTKNTQPEYEC